MYYEDFENYYEPSMADEILEEAKEKFGEILKNEIRSNIKNTQEEIIRLKKENEELKDKIRDLDRRERDIERKEKDIESKTEYHFYKKKFSELLKPLEEQLEMWYIEPLSELIPKCSLCDDERQIEYTSINGKKIKGDCDCKKYQRVYRVEEAKIKYLNFFKSDRTKREFILTPKYESKDYDNNYFKVDIQKLTKTFEIDKASEYKYCGSYGGFTGFTTKEECQKYCDWLNANEIIKVNQTKIL